MGVDLLPATGWRRFAVGEVNAFGDLLPGLTGLPGSGAEGLDTYAAQVAAQFPDSRAPDSRTRGTTAPAAHITRPTPVPRTAHTTSTARTTGTSTT